MSRGHGLGMSLAAAGSLALAAGIIQSAMTRELTEQDRQRAERLAGAIEKLRPLHRKLGPPRPGDWRAGPGRHEPGQTFAQYLRCRPVRPIGKRRVIYVQPLGEFTKTQRKIIDLAADFMGRYFALPVKVRKDLPLSIIPKSARRVHPTWGVKQILSTYVLEKVLVPRLPTDAAAYIAFTTSDLWPGRGWNFVFGQASLRQRVGVWSIYRNGNPDASGAAFRLCLVRTLKTASHETGHMFSMLHCTAYECNMCGSNHRAESDRRPLYLCPECAAKVCWATRTEPVSRCRKLRQFARKNGLADEAAFYAKSVEALGGTVEPAKPR
jgi:archaemetzincin